MEPQGAGTRNDSTRGRASARRRFRPPAAAAGLIAALLLAAPAGADAAATIVPTTTNDELTGNDDASCSLREAILSAETDDGVGGCMPAAGAFESDDADTILLPEGGVYVRSLIDPIPGEEDDDGKAGDLDVDGPGELTIAMHPAAARGAVIQGNGAADGGRVIEVLDGASLTLSGVTIRGGAGGIAVAGSLTLSSATVSGNAGTGTTIQDAGDATLENVTVSGNASAEPLGAGGIVVAGAGTLALGNATITANRGDAAGGVLAAPGADVTLDNTIVSGNFDSDAVDPSPDCAGTIGSLGHNLVKSLAGCDFQQGAPGDRIGQSARLGPLASNGGLTQTHGLFFDSPARNAGNPLAPDDSIPERCAIADQRGVTRPAGPRCDIGAFEGRVSFPPRPRIKCAGLRATLTGTRRGDRMRGTRKRDVIAGLGGADVIRGLGGNDVICGGRGSDRVFGARGSDVIHGQGGHDLLAGGLGPDDIHGGARRDRLFGGGGPDRLSGGRGWDRLFGGAGPDRLFGGPGRDRLLGGLGGDRLRGGPGRDDQKQ